MEQKLDIDPKKIRQLFDNDEDAERAMSYVNDVVHGLRAVRTFPQGVTVYGSARLPETDKYYEKARELGQLLAQNGHAVTTGGGPGIMEAANRGAFEYGGRSIGLNILLPHEQDTNAYLTDSVEFQYFFYRRVVLSMASKVYVFFPGGFGTMDEFTEILVLMQEGKMPKMPMFLFGKSFWKPLDRYFSTKLASLGLIHKSDTKIYTITDDVKEIVRAANKVGHAKIGENVYDKDGFGH